MLGGIIQHQIEILSINLKNMPSKTSNFLKQITIKQKSVKNARLNKNLNMELKVFNRKSSF